MCERGQVCHFSVSRCPRLSGQEQAEWCFGGFVCELRHTASAQSLPRAVKSGQTKAEAAPCLHPTDFPSYFPLLSSVFCYFLVLKLTTRTPNSLGLSDVRALMSSSWAYGWSLWGQVFFIYLNQNNIWWCHDEKTYMRIQLCSIKPDIARTLKKHNRGILLTKYIVLEK